MAVYDKSKSPNRCVARRRELSMDALSSLEVVFICCNRNASRTLATHMHMREGETPELRKRG